MDEFTGGSADEESGVSTEASTGSAEAGSLGEESVVESEPDLDPAPAPDRDPEPELESDTASGRAARGTIGVTYAWSAGGGVCEVCGDRSDRRWVGSVGLVCPSCKEW